MKPSGSEIGKLLVLASIPAMVTIVGKVPAQVSIILSLSHVLGLAIAGSCFLMIFNLWDIDSLSDRIIVSHIAGWVTTPFFIITAWIAGLTAVPLLLVLSCSLFILLLWLKKKNTRTQTTINEHRHFANIPISVYLISLAYTLISVALPFSSFSSESIFRELHWDGIQRFGTIYALSQDIPPQNPFFSGTYLRYYWFSLFPYSMEYRFIHNDLFDIWKSGQIWTSLFVVPALWYFTTKIFQKKVVSWSVVLFGFIFSSYEIIGHPGILRSILSQLYHFEGLHELLQSCLDALSSRDPDMVIGIITSYSDQLFMEDFLYIPQNMAALIAVVLGLWFMEEHRFWASMFVISSLASLNTFFVIPVFSAMFFLCFRGPRKEALWMSLILLGSYSVLWMVMCRILNVLSFSWALVIAMASTGLYACFSGKTIFRSLQSESSEPFLRKTALAFLISLLLLILLKPITNLPALILNYAPSLIIGLYFLSLILSSKSSLTVSDGINTLLFLLIAGITFNLVTLFIYLHMLDFIPPLIKNISYRVSLEVNLFNFYHKVGKLIRLTWAILAGLGLAFFGQAVLQYLKARRPIAFIVLLIIGAASLTSALRPFTYISYAPVQELKAAQYLLQKKEDIRTIVILEDFSGSQLNLLAPVGSFFYSSWSGGNPGLTHAVGNWSDQYLSKDKREESRLRETISRTFFTRPDNKERSSVLTKYGIDYILTRKKHDFNRLADLVVENEGGFLYKVKLGAQ